MAARISSIFTLLLVVLVFPLLTSCATMKRPTQTRPLPILSWEERQAVIGKIKNFHLNGKIAIQTARDSGSANVTWTESDDHYVISMWGPLGTHNVKLFGSEGAVVLQASDGRRYHAKSAEQLLTKQLGYHLPVSNLRYWVLGIPVPGVPYDGKFDQLHRLTYLTQAGFAIQFLNYTNAGRIDLPSKVFMSSPTLKTKLIIYNWQI